MSVLIIKVQDHYRIGEFLYSNRRDDPAMRQVMKLLLQNSYGIWDWVIVMQTLGKYRYTFEVRRESLEKSGLYAPHELKAEMAKIQEEISHAFAGFCSELRQAANRRGLDG